MKATSAKHALVASNLPLKAITHQDILTLQESLEQLQSWSTSLAAFNAFFSCTSVPLNKKKIIHDYYANSQIFTLFFQDFLKQTTALEKQIDDLRRRQKKTC